MPWVRYDDGFPRHPKVAEVKLRDRSALALHLLCSTRSASSTTPGRVTEAVTVEEAGSKARATKWARTLVDAGLWHTPGHDCERCPQIDKGYVFHDWKDWNNYEELSRKRSEAGKKGAAAKHAKGGKSGGTAMANAKPVDNSDSDNAEVTADKLESNSGSRGSSHPDEDRTGSNRTTSGKAVNGLANAKAEPQQTDGTPSGKNWPDPEPEPEPGFFSSVGDSPPRRNPGVPEGEAEDQQFAGDIGLLVEQVREIRPDWTASAITRALNRPDVLERPRHLIAPAMLAVARDPESQQPGRLAQGGPWWHEAARPQRPSGPPKCGDCNPFRRLEDDDGNDLGPCPTCHPKAVSPA